MKAPFLLACLTVVAACQTMPGPPAPDFDTTLERHLDAIQARDLAEMEATITTGRDLVLIFPDGTRLETREQFLDFHTDWFADKAWVMMPELLRTWQGRDYAYALLRYDYDPDGAGPAEARPSYLSLGFALEDGEWRLVHDQNTRITASEPE